jgi:hypothetical protein
MGETFEITDRMLWPARCPACKYLWTGLERAVCPECGEAVEEGEIVIVGMPARDQGAFADVASWGQGMFWIGCVGFVFTALMAWLKGAHGLVIVPAIAMTVLMAVIFSVMWWAWKRRGFPAGVLRLSPQGVVIGARERKGQVRPWPRALCVTIVRRTPEIVRLRGSVVWGPIALRDLFDVYALLTKAQATGVVERLRVWLPHQVVIRERTMRRWGKGKPVVRWAPRPGEQVEAMKDHT